MVESGRRCQRWCSEPLSSSVMHQRRLSRHHKVWDLEDIEHLRTWPALCRSAPVPTGFAATPSAPRAVLRAQGAHTPLLHTTGSSLHISIDCGSVGAGGRRKLQHGGGLCGSGAASASGAAFNWERGQSVAPLSQIENRDESRLSFASWALRAHIHSMHCPEIGEAPSQIDRGRRMTVNATLRSCAR